MSAPHALEDMLRIHDLAFSDWLGGLHVDYGNIDSQSRNNQSILRIYTTPDRAFAKTSDLLIPRGWISGADAAAKEAKVLKLFPVPPLPLATMVRGEPEPDGELSGVPLVFRSKFFNRLTGEWESHPLPGLYKTTYTVTFWASKKYSDAYMREWIYSKLGKLGSTNSELFIPVTHKAPWGVMNQALKFTGSSDNSDLEGQESRYIRTEFSFTLRTLMMRNIADSAPPMDRIGIDVQQSDGEDQTTDLETKNRIDVVSENVFMGTFLNDYWFKRWPVKGTATLARSSLVPQYEQPSDAKTAKLTLTGGTDGVELVERLITLDDSGHAMLSVSFRYKSDEDVLLDICREDKTGVDTMSTLFALTLPATREWKRVHVFVVLDTDMYTVNLRGIGSNSKATVYLYNFDVRHLTTFLSLVSPTNVVDNRLSMGRIKQSALFNRRVFRGNRWRSDDSFGRRSDQSDIHKIASH